jgi:7,8-dihydropterin-6-yl-methyl-4-(beta-D-ribofuranosyl)aminobenzene 5'-phosphate synthase
MNMLGVQPSAIEEVFISHAHFDHIGGLSAFLNENNNVKIYVPFSLRGIRKAKRIIYINKSMKLHKNMFTTGVLDCIEQSMVVKTLKGLVLIVGCSHPKMEKIIKSASQFGIIYAIIGGLHGFNEFELFKDFGLICPTHCTQHMTEIRSRYPDKYVEGGVGKVIEL